MGFKNALCNAPIPMPHYYLGWPTCRCCIRLPSHRGPHRNCVVEWDQDLKYPADFSDLRRREDTKAGRGKAKR